ncbi:MAG TPA: DUF2304 domain-containing protein [Terriglobia bacterium]|nr:DUF2304 domain-containing protein [Terriglobia bacterium]
MSPIQLILILLMVTAIATYFHRLRSKFLDNLIVLAIGTAGVVMIVMPKWTTSLAHYLGVGRGVDLIMYLAWIGVIFVCLLLYSKVRGIQSSVTELVRAQAIDNALRPKDRENNN